LAAARQLPRDRAGSLSAGGSPLLYPPAHGSSRPVVAKAKPPRSSAPAPPVPLATKLQVPPGRPRLGARPRLGVLLDCDPLPKVTLVAAPPGWGKTTVW